MKKQNDMTQNEQRNLIGRLMAYFDAAHQIFWKPVSFITNITVFYVLLFSQFPILYVIFPTIIHFGIVFSVCYILSMDAFGWWWMNRSGIWQGGMDIRFRTNPYFIELLDEVKKTKDELTTLKERLLIGIEIDDLPFGEPH